MRGAIPPRPNTPLWRGSQLKGGDNFTLPLFPKTLNTSVDTYFFFIFVFQGLGPLVCSGSEFIFLKLMNLFGQLVGLLGRRSDRRKAST
jgi:hypothetical protein